MIAKVNRICRASSSSSFFFAWTAGTRPIIEVLFVLYFVSNQESESEPEPESIRSPESEPESEQPYHDSAPLVESVNNFFKEQLSRSGDT